MPARGASALVAGLCGVFFSGCYQGEWRRGTEVPISATTRLMTVRTVETWELSQPGGGYVLQLKGSTMPRCRHALYGKTSRTDMFVSGEISEQTVHLARETGMPYLAAGHHATERYGVQAVGALLAQVFGIAVEFVDIDNPV